MPSAGTDERTRSGRGGGSPTGCQAKNSSLSVSSAKSTRKSIARTAIAHSGTNMTITVSICAEAGEPHAEPEAPRVALEDQHAGQKLHQADDQPEPAPTGEIDAVEHSWARAATVSSSDSAATPLNAL